MVFILHFVDVVYHIDRSVGTEESLHHWDKSYLTMLYDPFNIMLDLVCWDFVEDSCVYVHQGYWPVISFLAVYLSGFGIRVMMIS